MTAWPAPGSGQTRPDVGVAPASVRRAQEEAAAPASTDSIAVIVFSNISGAAEDDWIGTGIAETLRATFQRYTSLRGTPLLENRPFVIKFTRLFRF